MFISKTIVYSVFAPLRIKANLTPLTLTLTLNLALSLSVTLALKRDPNHNRTHRRVYEVWRKKRGAPTKAYMKDYNAREYDVKPRQKTAQYQKKSFTRNNGKHGYQIVKHYQNNTSK